MIIDSVMQIKSQPLFYHLNDFAGLAHCYLKLEGLNIAGSIKFKVAQEVIRHVESQYLSHKKPVTVVCSSSGNLGVALSIACKSKGIPLICVTDPNISPINEKNIKLYGGELIKVTKKDANGGYLASRIELIHSMLQNNPDYFWVNQYANQLNIQAHYQTTAKEIINSFKKIDYLFIGAGTTGTLMGCIKRFKEDLPTTQIIAVDAEGSVTFDKPAKKRYIPGIGTSLKPKIASSEIVEHLVMVTERDTVAMCHDVLDKYGLAVGGSTGSVLSAVKAYSTKIDVDASVVAISPDFGEHYVNTLYDKPWLLERNLISS